MPICTFPMPLSQELTNTQSELAILHKEQTRMRVNGWLDNASGLSTVRATGSLVGVGGPTGDSVEGGGGGTAVVAAGAKGPPSTLSGGNVAAHNAAIAAAGGGGGVGNGDTIAAVGAAGATGTSGHRASTPRGGDADDNLPLISTTSAVGGPLPPSASDTGEPLSMLATAALQQQLLEVRAELAQALAVQQQAVKDKASAEARAKEAEMAMEAAEAERLKAAAAFMSQVRDSYVRSRV